MKKLLITGANGQLGRALNTLLQDDHSVLIKNTDVDTLDIGDFIQVKELVDEFKPDIIINCAAYTAVDDCESKEDKAFYINAKGPENLALAAEESGAKLVHISTDYVFDGYKTTPYIETDETNPQSVYGSTKLAGEKNVQKNCKRHFIIRTAWLYGDGKNFVRTMIRLASERDVIRVVENQYGTPTSALELARMILFLMDTQEYGIYHGTCEGDTNWYQFAIEIFKQANISVRVEPIRSEEYKAAAKRPDYSILENNRLNSTTSYRMKNWKEALQEYMEEERNR